MNKFSSSPVSMVRSHWAYRNLIFQLAQREIFARYKGALFGSAWSLINPLLLLAIYTFVFGTVFKARWPGLPEQNNFQFALVLFAGLVPFNFFCEIFARAPGLVVANASYVKKIVFPLEILPAIALSGAGFHLLLNFLVLLAFQWMLSGTVYWTMLYAFPIFAALAITTLGVAWAFSAIGVYFKDLGQITAMAVTVLMFMSPLFYPVSALPESFQSVIHLNPLTFVIEELRTVVIAGGHPSPVGWGKYLLASFLFAWSGFWLFQKTRVGFADVL